MGHGICGLQPPLNPLLGKEGNYYLKLLPFVKRSCPSACVVADFGADARTEGIEIILTLLNGKNYRNHPLIPSLGRRGTITLSCSPLLRGAVRAPAS